MTEEEAAEKVCPFAPILKEPDGTTLMAACIGSKCMCWRELEPKWTETRIFLDPGEVCLTSGKQIAETWERLIERDKQLRAEGFEPFGEPKVLGYPSLYGKGRIAQGYCGAGGKP